MDHIKYVSGYKYQLHETYSIKLPFSVPDISMDHEFLKVEGGVLTVSQGYAWDGPSGPTIDTPSFMRGSLVHDALYQLMRDGLIDQSCRERADKLLRDLCIEDGMSWVRAAYVYESVREFGSSCAKISSQKVITAP